MNRVAFPSWLRLDNSANIWPAVLSSRYTSIFRLTVVLRERVQLERLQRALDASMERFPYFKVCIRRGLFWYYLEPRIDWPRVQADSANPCMQANLIGKKNWPFRVRVFSSRISLEMSHILSDGSGAAVFLRYLIEEYLKPNDSPPASHQSTSDSDEWVDSYHDLIPPHSSKLPKRALAEKAFHPHGRLLPSGRYQVVSLLLDADQLLSFARKASLSLTEYLASLLLMVLQEQQEALVAKKKRVSLLKPIRLNIPVNLRSFFPSKTLRNFFTYVDPGIDPRLGVYQQQEVQEQVHHHFRFLLDPKRLRHMVDRNIQGERNLAARLTPLFFKDLFLERVFRTQGDQRVSASFSNLGRLSDFSGDQGRVSHLVFLPPPSPLLGVNMTAVSYGKQLCISFGGIIDSTALAAGFVKYLVERGIEAKIEANHISHSEESR